MKKFLLSITNLILISSLLTTVSGQDTINYKDNWLSFEGQVYPSFNGDNYRPQFKIRLNFNEKSALRLNTNFQRKVDYKEIYESGGQGVGSVDKISSMYQFSIGYEAQKKLANTLIYSGTEGIFGFGRNDEYGSRTDSVTYISNLNYNYKQPVQSLGVRLFMGGEYYIKPNIYIGTEFGLMLIKTTYQNRTYETIFDSSSSNSSVSVDTPKNSSSALLFSGLGMLRVGFIFK